MKIYLSSVALVALVSCAALYAQAGKMSVHQGLAKEHAAKK